MERVGWMGVHLGRERLAVLVEPHLQAVERLALDVHEEAGARLAGCLARHMAGAYVHLGSPRDAAPEDEQLVAGAPGPAQRPTGVGQLLRRDHEAANGLETAHAGGWPKSNPDGVICT